MLLSSSLPIFGRLEITDSLASRGVQGCSNSGSAGTGECATVLDPQETRTGVPAFCGGITFHAGRPGHPPAAKKAAGNIALFKPRILARSHCGFSFESWIMHAACAAYMISQYLLAGLCRG
jgi:hypothetical protein